ncbi:hypothetical protein ACIBHY_30650 [Nonomuraea sp. NPDC050547]|uniref:hypothetical protein n=1 Tax=Nonomuraea sp. NPDC050547 TaxID=3364368 RepID=UPI0037AF3C2E
MTFEELAGEVHAAVSAGELSGDRVVELAVELEGLGVAVPADLDLRTLLTGFARLDLAVRTVQRDLDATAVPGRLRVCAPAWGDGWLRVEYGGQASSTGFDPRQSADPLAEVADLAQEIIVEVLWTSWPLCPVHGFGLHVNNTPEWVCTGAKRHVVAPVGRLGEG